MTTTTATRPTAARTRRTRTTTTVARDTTGQPAAAPATTDANGTNHSHASDSHANGSHANGSEQRVRAAVSEGTDLTVAALADATGLGRSTVSKALTRLEAAGHAVRTTSGSAGRARQPDRWNPTRTATTDPPPPSGPQAQPGPERAPEAARSTQPQPEAHPESEAEAESEPTASAAARAADHAAGDGQPTARRRSTNGRAEERRPSTADTPPAPDLPALPATGGADAPRNPKTGTARLAPGALTQLVADHFSAHPGVPLTSGEVGRALGRSGGAVRNAADKLTHDGVLRLLDGTPRRYTTAE